MRQPMLLEQLVALTHEKSANKKVLEDALEKVKSVVSAVDQRKFEHEQKVKLAAIFDRIRGDVEEDLLPESRYLLKEGAMIEVKRRTSSRSSEHESSDNEELSVRVDSLERFNLLRGRRANKYAILCNDSFWYCELLRGNRYRPLHVFHFSQHNSARLSSASARWSSAVNSHTAGTAFYVSDREITLCLQPARSNGSEAGDWVNQLVNAMELQREAAMSMSKRNDSTPKARPEGGLNNYLADYRKRFGESEPGIPSQADPTLLALTAELAAPTDADGNEEWLSVTKAA